MRYFSSLRASTDSYEMSMSVSDFQQFAANCAGLSAAAANSAPVFNGQQQQVTASIATQARTPQQTLATVPPSSSLTLPQQSAFPSYPQPPQYPGQIQNPQAYPTASVATSSSSGMNFSDHLAALSAAAAAASGTPNSGMSIPNGGMSVADLSAFAAASHQQQAGVSADMNGVPKQANNVFNLSNLSEMDVMKLFQKNATLQNGYEIDDKMSSMKDAMQPNLMNGIKRQMVMPTSMNAATLQSYQEQLASCLPPNAKRATLPTANPYGIPASSIAQMVAANGQQQSAMMMAGGSTLSVTPQQQQAMPNMMQQNLLANAVSASASQFMLSNQLPHTVNSAAATMPSNSLAQNIMALQQMPGQNAAATMSSLQQQQQNWQLAAAFKQNQLKQAMLQQQQQAAAAKMQQNMHPQAAAAMAAQAAARAQAIRESQIMQQHQQRQQRLAAIVQPSAQQHIPRRRVNHAAQAAAVAAACAAATSSSCNTPASSASSTGNSVISSNHATTLGDHLANVIVSVGKTRTTTPAEGHKLSTTVIAQPQPVSENGVEVLNRLPNTPITSAALIQNGTKSSNFGPDDERFQAFLASIRSHVELQIAANRSATSSVAAKEVQTPPPVNVTLSQPIVSNGTAENQQTTQNTPEITDDTGRKSEKIVSRTQTPNCVDPVSI
ncbi:hypothetical protein DdX_03173 [Ditylenchus destructor]|uniref:Uncharacterized protein n=1 Tax=Ditylenchus destructor TaxID=166010 RepID=A0AAD4RCR9_9BILA|nr:hypothetical protein DdX_03173 [Ditylenchus destructor]